MCTSINIVCLQVPELPQIVQGLRFYIQYRPVTRSYSRARYIYPSSVNDTEVMFTIESLSRDTAYSIRAQVQMRYTYCSNYIYGNFSDPEIFRTNATCECGMSVAHQLIMTIPVARVTNH